MIRWRHRFVRRLFLTIARPMFRLRIDGAENLPESGPAILVANHRSWLDPPLLGAASPRPVHFLILDDVYHKWWARWFYRWMQTIPVSGDTKSTIFAVREAMRRLRSGEVIGIFPEGRVFSRQQPGEFRPGVAMLARCSGAPIVPIHIRGSAEAWPRGRPWPRPAHVRVRIGSPITPAETGHPAADDLIGRIEAALDERS
jgi:1-acyl-sn-glycerol-3-phosphate acyltransferase